MNRGFLTAELLVPLALLTTAVLVLLQRFLTRPAPSVDTGVEVRPQPPEDVRPVDVGVLLTGRVQDRDVAAVIVDLLVRGALRVEDRADGPVLLAGDTQAPGLTVGEHVLALDVQQRPAGVPMADVGTELATYVQRLGAEVVDRARVRGWFAPASPCPPWVWLPGQVLAAGVLFSGSFLLAVITGWGVVAGARRFGASPFRRTARGEQAAAQLNAFRRFLETERRTNPGGTARHLPWLVALGLEDDWGSWTFGASGLPDVQSVLSR